MKYEIYRTDKANDQLHAIIQYIAADSGSAEVALRYLEKLEKAIRSLETSPHMGGIPRYAILKRQGYRVLIVERNLIFYKVDDEAKRVVLYAVVDARQGYVNLV